nr:unnamed protein product [Haemonchus contortus]
MKSIVPVELLARALEKGVGKGSLRMISKAKREPVFDASAEDTSEGFVAESEMIYNPQRWPPEQRKKAYALADKYNQNIRPEEYISPQIARGLPQ